jgi:hypothetical protein
VRILQDLERFKDLPIYVRCIESPSDNILETLEKDGVLELESVGMDVGSAKWKLAEVSRQEGCTLAHITISWQDLNIFWPIP